MRKALMLLSLLGSLTFAQVATTGGPSRPKPSDFKDSQQFEKAQADYIDAMIDWKVKQATQAPQPKPQCKTLAACRAQISALTEEINTSTDRMRKLSKSIEDQNAQLAAMQTKYDELKKAAGEVLQYAQRLDTEYSSVVEKNNKLTSDYNSLLDTSRQMAANLRTLEQNQRNAAIYQAILGMRPAQPTQTINLQVSDCTKLPALCVR